MKNITEIKRKLEKYFAKKYCGIDDINLCPKGNECTCKVVAEIRAYIETIIPSGFKDVTIKDFIGRDLKGNKILNDEITISAKKKLLSFCWEGVSLKDISGPNQLKDQELSQLSIMDKRKNKASNVVVYAGSSINTGGGSGKTLIASLIMKEAIKRRSFPGNYSDSYDWVDFNRLKQSIIQDDRQYGVGYSGLVDTRYCNWLVIDDIPSQFSSSPNSKMFLSSVLDPFISERVESKLSTIFVFCFDIIKQSLDVEKSFGISIAKIIKDPKTCIISLNNGDNS